MNESQINSTFTKVKETVLYRNIPLMTFLGSLCTIGILGNIIVIIVYIARLKMATNYRIFILLLSFLHLLGCFVIIPYRIVTNIIPPFLVLSASCRILAFLDIVVVVGTFAILLIMSIERYYIECKPFSNKMTLQASYMSCTVAMVLSVLLATPSTIINGSINKNETGEVYCSISRVYKTSVFPMVYHGLLGVLVLGTVLVLCVIHSSIGNKICQYVNRKSRENRSKLDQYQNESISLNCVTPNIDLKEATQTNIENEVQEDVTLDDKATSPSLDNNIRCNVKRMKSVVHTIRGPEVRVSFVSLLITLVFIITYIPSFIYRIYLLQELNDNFTNQTETFLLQNSLFTQYVFCIRYLHVVVNPVIYTIFDKVFRKALFKRSIGKRRSNVSIESTMTSTRCLHLCRNSDNSLDNGTGLQSPSEITCFRFYRQVSVEPTAGQDQCEMQAYRRLSRLSTRHVPNKKQNV